MTESPLTQAACLAEQLFALISNSPDSLSNLLVVQGVIRQAERVTVEQIAAVERDGSLAEKGYRSTVLGLKDLLGWDHDTASRHLKVAQHVGPRTALDGSPLEPVLPATAAAFTAGATTMRHVEVIAGLMSSKVSARISADDRRRSPRAKCASWAGNSSRPPISTVPGLMIGPAATNCICTAASTAPGPSTASSTTRPRSPRS